MHLSRKSLILFALFTTALLSGCMNDAMRSTPFNADSSSVYVGRTSEGKIVRYDDKEAVEKLEVERRMLPVEGRIVGWPFVYYRNPILSVMWPLFEKTDVFTTLRGFYYNDELKNRSVLTALFLAGNYQSPARSDHWFFPLYWFYRPNDESDAYRANYLAFLGGHGRNKESSFAYAFPLFVFKQARDGSDATRSYLAFLAGYDRDYNARTNTGHIDRWFFPLFNADYDKSAAAPDYELNSFSTLLGSWSDDGSRREYRALLGLLGYYNGDYETENNQVVMRNVSWGVPALLSWFNRNHFHSEGTGLLGLLFNYEGYRFSPDSDYNLSSLSVLTPFLFSLDRGRCDTSMYTRELAVLTPLIFFYKNRGTITEPDIETAALCTLVYHGEKTKESYSRRVLICLHDVSKNKDEYTNSTFPFYYYNVDKTDTTLALPFLLTEHTWSKLTTSWGVFPLFNYGLARKTESDSTYSLKNLKLLCGLFTYRDSSTDTQKNVMSFSPFHYAHDTDEKQVRAAVFGLFGRSESGSRLKRWILPFSTYVRDTDFEMKSYEQSKRGDYRRYGYLLSLCGYSSFNDSMHSNWFFPFYYFKRDALNPTYRTWYALLGLGGGSVAPDSKKIAWAFPFYFDKSEGKNALSSAMPASQTTLGLLGLMGSTLRESRRISWIAPLLSASKTTYKKRSCSAKFAEKTPQLQADKSAYWLLGLGGYHKVDNPNPESDSRSLLGSVRSSHFFPLWFHDRNAYFATPILSYYRDFSKVNDSAYYVYANPLFGRSYNERKDESFTYYLTPLFNSIHADSITSVHLPAGLVSYARLDSGYQPESGRNAFSIPFFYTYRDRYPFDDRFESRLTILNCGTRECVERESSAEKRHLKETRFLVGLTRSDSIASENASSFLDLTLTPFWVRKCVSESEQAKNLYERSENKRINWIFPSIVNNDVHRHIATADGTSRDYARQHCGVYPFYYDVSDTLVDTLLTGTKTIASEKYGILPFYLQKSNRSLLAATHESLSTSTTKTILPLLTSLTYAQDSERGHVTHNDFTYSTLGGVLGYANTAFSRDYETQNGVETVWSASERKMRLAPLALYVNSQDSRWWLHNDGTQCTKTITNGHYGLFSLLFGLTTKREYDGYAHSPAQESNFALTNSKRTYCLPLLLSWYSRSDEMPECDLRAIPGFADKRKASAVYHGFAPLYIYVNERGSDTEIVDATLCDRNGKAVVFPALLSWFTNQSCYNQHAVTYQRHSYNYLLRILGHSQAEEDFENETKSSSVSALLYMYAAYSKLFDGVTTDRTSLFYTLFYDRIVLSHGAERLKKTVNSCFYLYESVRNDEDKTGSTRFFPFFRRTYGPHYQTHNSLLYTSDSRYNPVSGEHYRRRAVLTPLTYVNTTLRDAQNAVIVSKTYSFFALYGNKYTENYSSRWVGPFYYGNREKKIGGTEYYSNSFGGLLCSKTRLEDDNGALLYKQTRVLDYGYTSEEKDGVFDAEIFPFMSYHSDAAQKQKKFVFFHDAVFCNESKGEDYTHVSLAWRLFRYHSEGDSTKVDFLFIPVYRK